MSFIFEELEPKKAWALRLNRYWYYYKLPDITFKTQYELEETGVYGLFTIKLISGIYFIDINGNVLLKTSEDKAKMICAKIKQRKDRLFQEYDSLKEKEDEKKETNPKYKFMFKFEFDETPYFCAQSRETGLWGVIDENGNVKIPFMYDFINFAIIEYEKKTIPVQKDNKYALVDINNNILLDFKYKYIFGFIDGEYSLAEDENGKWGIINRKGEEINVDLNNVKKLSLKFSRKKATEYIRNNSLQSYYKEIWEELTSTKNYNEQLKLKYS